MARRLVRDLPEPEVVPTSEKILEVLGEFGAAGARPQLIAERLHMPIRVVVEALRELATAGHTTVVPKPQFDLWFRTRDLPAHLRPSSRTRNLTMSNNEPIDPKDRLLVELVNTLATYEQGISARRLSQKMEETKTAVLKTLNELRELGIVTKTGNRRSSLWHLG